MNQDFAELPTCNAIFHGLNTIEDHLQKIDETLTEARKVEAA